MDFVRSVAISNPSALPQRFGFVPLPKHLDVQPGDGLGTILPGETIQREVSRFSLRLTGMVACALVPFPYTL